MQHHKALCKQFSLANARTLEQPLSTGWGIHIFFLVICGCQGIASQSLVPCNRSFSKAPISKQNVPINLESGVKDLFFHPHLYAIIRKIHAQQSELARNLATKSMQIVNTLWVPQSRFHHRLCFRFSIFLLLQKFELKKFKTNFLNRAKQMTSIGSGTSDAWCKRRRQFELHFRCCQPKPQTVQSTTDRNKNLAPGYCNRTNTTALKNQNKFIIMIIVSHWQIFTPQKMADGYLHTSLRKNTIKNVMS